MSFKPSFFLNLGITSLLCLSDTIIDCSSKGLKIMNLNEARATEGVPVLPDEDDAVDPHLERIKNEAGGDDSDEEVIIPICNFELISSS